MAEVVVPTHEHEWQGVGKRWMICSVRGCTKARLTLVAEWWEFSLRNANRKTLFIEFDGVED